MLRQHFSKGTDLSIHGTDEITDVAAALNSQLLNVRFVVTNLDPCSAE
ncbi:hypothetical protein [Mesorhizobium sp. M0139]